MNPDIKKIRFGIIGTSTITELFLHGAQLDNRFELSAVYSRSYEHGKMFADKYGVKNVFTVFDAMCGYIDAVYIASPNSCHAEQAIFFLNKGIHVLCEKPLCSNLSEAEKMVETAIRNNVVLMEAMISTLNPNFRALKNNLARVGAVREYFSCYCQYSSRYNKYRQGIIENAFRPELSNGALVDIGIYTIYPMVVLFGKPKTVKAIGYLLDSGVDGSGTVIFEYEGGMQATVIYSKISSSDLGTQVQGEDGTLCMEKINIPRHLVFKPISGGEQDLSAGHCGDDYFYEARDFIDLIVQGRSEHEINSHAHSLLVMEILDEVRRQIGLVYPADKNE